MYFPWDGACSPIRSPSRGRNHFHAKDATAMSQTQPSIPESQGAAGTATPPSIDMLSINTIRTLSMDAVQKANSGHPGTPMALAPIAYTLWQSYLRYDPADPQWPDRDRF